MADTILQGLSQRVDPSDLDGIPHRRSIPEGSGALACVGFDWESIVQLLTTEIAKAAPELKRGETVWVLRARPNGIRIEFYEDENALARRVEQHTSLTDGAQIHAGRLTWW